MKKMKGREVRIKVEHTRFNAPINSSTLSGKYSIESVYFERIRISRSSARSNLFVGLLLNLILIQQFNLIKNIKKK